MSTPITLPLESFIPFLIGLGVTNVIYMLAKTQSYRLAEASLITPIAFTTIIWAGLFDYLIWQKLPTPSLILGAAIIITANLTILHRERTKT